MTMDFLSLGILSLVILVFSAIFHEVAHGWIADRLGDPTARLHGRLTLNPISHIDPVMSIILPLLLIMSGSPVIFGAAKPVPVDPFNLRDGRRDMALVALAGPATNVLLALIFAAAIHILLPIGIDSFLIFVMEQIVRLNLLLAIFNLIPIPPLDGSKVFSLLLPEKEAASYLSIGSVGMFILFFLLLFPIGGFSLGNIIFNLLTLSLNLLGL
ncbi:MAG: site-2 protease family protein [Candidatus Levybacteria bacterium]|nr:site-2 protease family protein [Candidatus Levybacteria bacterium]